MATLDQRPSARSAFQARIRQLQRIGLLRNSDGKTYVRFTYGLVELAALATAFRLMSAFMLPIVAVRYLNECWADFLPALVAGLGDQGLSRWDNDAPPAVPFFAIEGTALAQLGQKGAGDARYEGPLGSVRCIGPIDSVGTVWQAAAANGLLIDTRSYMAQLVAALAALETVGPAQLADEIDRLRFSSLKRLQNPSD